MDPAEEIVDQVVEPLRSFELPPELLESAERHKKHLISLATALLMRGADESDVRQSVELLFQSYKDELVRTILVVQNG